MGADRSRCTALKPVMGSGTGPMRTRMQLWWGQQQVVVLYWRAAAWEILSCCLKLLRHHADWIGWWRSGMPASSYRVALARRRPCRVALAPSCRG